MRRGAALALVLVLAGCTGQDVSESVVPGETWDRVEPAEAGFDPQLLAEAEDVFEENNSTCFALVKDGRLVHEATWDLEAETPQPVFSVTKSFTSVLVGIAEGDGLLSLDDPVADHVPEWRGTASESVTIRDILANVSGRRWDSHTDYTQLILTVEDKTEFAVGLDQEAEPGTVWRYNNAAIQVLSAVLREVTGMEPAEFARTRLFEPLGMSHTRWLADDAGHTMVFGGVESTCQDVARLGLLMMRDGRWGDEQVVPESFVRAAVGEPSSSLNAAYGLLWWINAEGQQTEGLGIAVGGPERTYTGRLAQMAPPDTFWALGLGTQFMVVMPSEGVVAVRLGAGPADPGFNPTNLTYGILAAQTPSGAG